MCTTQPVFQVSVNEQVTYLCGKCLAEHYIDSEVRILNDNHVVGETCQCIVCE
ncbi:hypothetical protein ACM55I_08850 [Flavobacterium sp. GB2R13]|jgi:hypothetical protein|uniref:hypothetical protein n=1 Tax=Flavobacterium algoris TaxID=3398733 RepID=UPI000E3AC98C